MSKKIIYLLSLLMALSLVFASCKKNPANPGGIGGDLPNEDPGNIAPPDLSTGGGLFTDKGKLDEYAVKPVQASPVAKYENNNYMRNPVITVINGQTVVVFYEIRYQTPGAGNDVALTGDNVVDIAYTVSSDAGTSFNTSAAITGYVGGQAKDAATSHGAPIVFNTGKKIVVVASAGIGLSSGVYQQGVKESKLEYAVADITGDTIGTFSEWKPIENVDKGSFNQFGTHSARGTVTSDGKLLLPVTLATYPANKFGYVLYIGTVDDSNTVTWTKKGSVIDMPSNVKETRIVSGTDENNYVALAVPGGNGGKLYKGVPNQTPATTTIAAGDGSVGTLVVKDWRGATSYDPKEYASSFANGSGAKQSIVSHVIEVEKRLAVRLVNEDFSAQVGNSFELEGSDEDNKDAYKLYSKSSSIDVLKDGTIVMVAEGGKVDPTVTDRTYFIYFNRYTQAYLASKTAAAN